MACQISFLLILTGLMGIDCMPKVYRVSVKTGGSISFPCLYEAQYTRNVKYWCKGRDCRTCSSEIKSNQENSQKYLISDDKKQKVFTVTIKDLTGDDTEYYWCAVETNTKGHYIRYFYLSVTTGIPSLYVDDQFKTSTGQSIAIKCSHNNSGQNEWCRLGGSCVIKSSGSVAGSRVIISESENFFTVTMSGLKPKNSGWYFCVRGDVQMPVHVTVTDGRITSTTILNIFADPEITTVPNVHLNVTEKHVTSATLNKIFADPETTTFPYVHPSTCQDWVSLPLRLNILIIVTPFICFLLKRYVVKKRKEPSTPAAHPSIVHSSQDGEGVANTAV